MGLRHLSSAAISHERRVGPGLIRHRRRVALVAALVGLAACGGSAGSSTGTDGLTSAADDGTAVVSIENLRFNPGDTEIKAGDTVRWVWDENVLHNVSGDGFDSGNQTEGSFSHTFPAAGTYEIHCTLHSGMEATVEVTS
jgi:plastocyanin